MKGFFQLTAADGGSPRRHDRRRRRDECKRRQRAAETAGGAARPRRPSCSSPIARPACCPRSGRAAATCAWSPLAAAGPRRGPRRCRVADPAGPRWRASPPGRSATASAFIRRRPCTLRPHRRPVRHPAPLDRPRALALADRAGAARARTPRPTLIFTLVLTLLARLAPHRRDRHGPARGRTRRSGAAGPPRPPPATRAAPGPTCRTLAPRIRHGRAVNLDPAALLLDMVLKAEASGGPHCPGVSPDV